MEHILLDISKHTDHRPGDRMPHSYLKFGTALYLLISFTGPLLSYSLPTHAGDCIEALLMRVPPHSSLHSIQAPVFDREAHAIWSELESFWRPRIEALGIPFQPARLVIYNNSIDTKCGRLERPCFNYCDEDQTLYMESNFWADLRTHFGVYGADIRMAALAHDYGHHVQHLLGLLTRSSKFASRLWQRKHFTQLRALQELSADSFSGYFLQHRSPKKRLSERSIQRIRRAFNKLGSDSIFEKFAGPTEGPRHVSGNARAHWLNKGLIARSLFELDPFSDPDLLGAFPESIRSEVTRLLFSTELKREP
jgi:predicted metalloprotease